MKENQPNNSSQDPSRKLFSSSFANQQTHQIPEIQLPKGGGALKGIDEKFEVNPVNGTNSVSIPLPVSPSRAGFSPNLAIQYNSGQGNGLFGMGWSLGLPSIRRKTDRQLPQYKDAIDSDVYIFAGAEDLIPKLIESQSIAGQWDLAEEPTLTGTHLVRQYRPRIEGSWLRIERWTELGTGIIHWRTISTTNVITVYGDTRNSRIENPQLDSGEKVFEWLISYSYDNLGNIIRYEYKEENLSNVAPTVYEKNRNSSNVTNRYLKRVHYGNKAHYHHDDALPSSSDFLFETVFDYGEHHAQNPTPQGVSGQAWESRVDAFSSFRSGFDIRTYRACKRVLLFHKFTAEQPIDDLLVSSVEFDVKNYPDKATGNPLEGFTYLRNVIRKGYIYKTAGITTDDYDYKELPTLSFYYQQHAWNTEIKTLDEAALKNTPTGINNSAYRWTDLYGEGLSGILIEEQQAWYYQENLGKGSFSAAKLLSEKPSFNGLNVGVTQFQDLEGNGERQLVNWSSQPQGYFNYKEGEKWEGFQAFESVPNRNLLNDPNSRFIDLDGDGRPDLLITENDLFQWHYSKGKKGFEKANQIHLPLNDEEGPKVVFADQTQSIFLADMTGDGMTDIVRIQNGMVCYWANQGYGQFSAKITMAGAPKITSDDVFHPKYIQLMDIDGSGTADIAYLFKDSIQIWMNHSGNSFLPTPQIIHPFPPIDGQANIDLVDLLGTGTACIVWSSFGAKDQGQPLRYIDLADGNKPHLLYKYENNTGAEVQFEYKSSTHFYLEDKKAGTPWATKLPFPVHVLSRTKAIDHIRNTVFVSRYEYHHGYYDFLEREFRGFGRVEQFDTEYFNLLAEAGTANIHADHFQLPIKTVSWFHTGASFKNQYLTDAYRQEYFQNAGVEQALNGISIPQNLSDKAYHEAFRACKGVLLRQEVYSLDIHDLKSSYPYSTSESAYEVLLVQPHEGQEYASFSIVSKESMSYAYERHPSDPRITQSLVLDYDDLGIPTKTASIIYPRLTIPSGLLPLVQAQQEKIHAIYTKIQLTDDVDLDHAYRLRTGYEEQIYEVLGLSWALGTAYYNKNTFNSALAGASALKYEEDYVLGTGIKKRLSGHGKALFLKDDLSGALGLGIQESLGIPYKSYQLAYTSTLLQVLYETGAGTNLLSAATIGGVSANLDLPQTTGYETDVDGNWWLPSGETEYITGATNNFFLPLKVKDALGSETKISFDAYNLFPILIEDALQNTVQATYDYRTLSPKSMIDLNGNQSVVAFDELGIVVRSAIVGKAGEGDSLLHPTAEMDYNFLNWQIHGLPNYIHSKFREEHYSVDPNSGFQESYEYSDGSGAVIMVKVQTTDGEAKDWTNGVLTMIDTTNHPTKSRWIGNGRTILDNKGNPIKQYEPYFSTTHEYEDEDLLVQDGVTSILYYDAAGRNIKTVLPNGTFVKTEFDAWQSATYDANDTVLDSDWYAQYDTPGNQAILNSLTDPLNASPELRAAWLAKQHANTPSRTHLDILGRTIYGEEDDGTVINSIYTETDLSGRYSKIYDQIATEELKTTGSTNRGESSYSLTNLLGQTVYTKTAAKGESWSFSDILGRMIRIWDNPDDPTHRLTFRSVYDSMHRPLETYVEQGINPEICFGKTRYGESITPANSSLNAAQIQAANLNGQAYQSFDQSGMMTSPAFDFKGNPLEVKRQLLLDYTQTVDWNQAQPMETDVFQTNTTYDALNRPKETTLPNGIVMLPTYSKGGYLELLQANINGTLHDFMKGQNFDAKGQRESVQYGNDSITEYFYDAQTFRLTNLLTTAGPSGSPQTLQDLHYTYDPVGNITQVKDDAQATFYYNNQAILPVKKYRYDALYRLIEARGREHQGAAAPSNNDLAHLQNLTHVNMLNALSNYHQNYDYDLAGNILQMQHHYGTVGGWTRDYTYDLNDASNRLLDTKMNGNTYPNTYDIHGNMTSMAHLQAMHWNFMDELVQVELNSSGDRAYYNYDGGGQRVRKVIQKGNGREERLYLGGLERYREYSNNGTVLLERWTLQVDDIAQVDIETTGGTATAPLIRYQYRDHLGSASLECNEQVQIISYEEYHPFGTSAYRTAKSGTNLSLKRYRFTNKERDDETGLYYFGVRYYAAWLGRWTSSDPGGFVDGLNLYRYVRNNPVILVDRIGTHSEAPTGVKSCPPNCGCPPPCESKSNTQTQSNSNKGGTTGNNRGNHIGDNKNPFQETQKRNPRPNRTPKPSGGWGILGRILKTGAAIPLLIIGFVLMPTTAHAPGQPNIGYLPDSDGDVIGSVDADGLPQNDVEPDTDGKPKAGADSEPDTDGNQRGKYAVYVTLRDEKALAKKRGEKTIGRRPIASVDQPLYYVGISKNENERYTNSTMQHRYMNVILSGLTKEQARGAEQLIIELNTGGKGYPAGYGTLDNILNSTSPSRDQTRFPSAPNDDYSIRNVEGRAILNTRIPDWQTRLKFDVSTQYNTREIPDELEPIDRIRYPQLYN